MSFGGGRSLLLWALLLVGAALPLQAQESLGSTALQTLLTQPLGALPAGLSVAVLVLLLMASAAVSGSEAAYFSLNRAKLLLLEEDRGEAVAGRVKRLVEQPSYLLSTILIANNFINVAIVVVSWFLLSGLMANAAPWLVFLVNVVGITFLLVLFGEVIPKVYAQRHTNDMAARMARPLLFLRQLFKPLSVVLVRSTGLIEKRLQRMTPENVSLEEFESAIDIAVDENTTEQEVKILKGILNFGTILVKQIMTSHVDMTAVDQRMDFHALVEVVRDSGYSRIPVYDGDKDNIVGIFYAKDLLASLDEDAGFDWRGKLREPYFVPETKKIDELLREFQEKHMHLAIVVDEYGGTSGLVTLEDIMEEVIGEIEDEFDEVEVDHRRVDDCTYVFAGKVQLGDACRVLNIRPEVFDPVRGDADTLAGLLLEMAGRIPEAQQELNFGAYRFKVLSVGRSRIDKVQVTLPKPPATTPGRVA
jgi:gliding motility-associated protein GldE